MNDVEQQNRAAMKAERGQIHRSQVSNAETYDRYILALSSSLLGFSAVFLTHLGRNAMGAPMWILVTSWAFLGLAVVSTLGSIMYGQRVLRVLMDGTEDYYIKGDESSRERSAILSRRVDRVNMVSGALFIAGVLFLIVFSGDVAMNMQSSKHLGESGQQGDFGKSAPPNSYTPRVPNGGSPGDSSESSGSNHQSDTLSDSPKS